MSVWDMSMAFVNVYFFPLQSTKDESDKVRKLQLELATLRKQYNQKQDENSKSVNMLKHELESSKQEYEKRLQHFQLTRPDLEPEVANEKLAQNRVRALETQVSLTYP